METTKLNVLLLEDNPDDAELEMLALKRIGFDVKCICTDTEESFKENLCVKNLDLILIDCSIPGFNCKEILEFCKNNQINIPIIIVSGTIGEETAVSHLKAGATDYVLKGNLIRLGQVVKRAITERSLRKQYNFALRKRASDLQETLDGIVDAITVAVEYKDMYTAGHQRRTARLSKAIAERLKMDKDAIKGIYIAAMLHDVGKVAIPSDILSKPAALSKLEMALVKEHAIIGYNILKPIKFPCPVAKMVLQHHERIDGSGYPNGLLDRDIIIGAKILMIADTVEAMSFHRPYRPAIGITNSLKEISLYKGKTYDKEVVIACLRIFEDGSFKFD